MFPGWRVRIACLSVGERIEIPRAEFEQWETSEGEGDTIQVSGKIKLLGKLYEFWAVDSGLVVGRLE